MIGLAWNYGGRYNGKPRPKSPLAMDRPVLDFAEARNRMVDSQIRPNKVTDPRIVAAMRRIPRERFLPPRLVAMAYVDEDVPLGGGRYLIEPMVIARLVQLHRHFGRRAGAGGRGRPWLWRRPARRMRRPGDRARGGRLAAGNGARCAGRARAIGQPGLGPAFGWLAARRAI